MSLAPKEDSARISTLGLKYNRPIGATFAPGRWLEVASAANEGEGFTLREVDLFGLILSVQMLVIIALGLHNRHLAALVREKSSVIEILRRTLGTEGETPDRRPSSDARVEVAAADL